MPDGDSLITAPAVAANSALYLRGTERLYAFDSAGEILWSRPVGPPPSPPSVAEPVPLADSGVVLATSNGRVTAWSPAGEEMWTFELPAGGRLVGHPQVSPNGMIWLATGTDLMALSPAGKSVIQRKLQRPSADEPAEP